MPKNEIQVKSNIVRNFYRRRLKYLIKKLFNKPMKLNLALVYWGLAIIVGLMLRYFVPVN